MAANKPSIDYGSMENPSETPAPPYTARESTVEAPPPSYVDTQNEAPPPSYESIFGEIQEARRTATGRGNFLKNVCKILFSTIGFTILIGLLLAIPVLMIVVGALNIGNCPEERMIPIWLIVGGATGALMQLLSICKRIKNRCKNESEEDNQNSTSYNSCSGLIGCFNVAWFFAGNVWVYKLYPDYSHADCDPVAYYLSFWLLTSIYICVALVCCCSCCIAMCAGASE